MTGPYVIIYQGLAGYTAEPSSATVGSFLQAYSAEAHGGQGEALWTRDPAKALQFRSTKEAMELWRKIPWNRPTRPDGKPNRPLTSITVSIEPKKGKEA